MFTIRIILVLKFWSRSWHFIALCEYRLILIHLATPCVWFILTFLFQPSLQSTKPKKSVAVNNGAWSNPRYFIYSGKERSRYLCFIIWFWNGSSSFSMRGLSSQGDIFSGVRPNCTTPWRPKEEPSNLRHRLVPSLLELRWDSAFNFSNYITRCDLHKTRCLTNKTVGLLFRKIFVYCYRPRYAFRSTCVT